MRQTRRRGFPKALGGKSGVRYYWEKEITDIICFGPAGVFDCHNGLRGHRACKSRKRRGDSHRQGSIVKDSARISDEDTIISANMMRIGESICFEFGPDGTTFAEGKPAVLMISWMVVLYMRLCDFTLYGEDGSEIRPGVRWWGLEYGIDSFAIEHFSLFYYRRR